MVVTDKINSRGSLPTSGLANGGGQEGLDWSSLLGFLSDSSMGIRYCTVLKMVLLNIERLKLESVFNPYVSTENHGYGISSLWDVVIFRIETGAKVLELYILHVCFIGR